MAARVNLVESKDLRRNLAEESREGPEQRDTGGDIDHPEQKADQDAGVREVQEDKPLSAPGEAREQRRGAAMNYRSK